MNFETKHKHLSQKLGNQQSIAIQYEYEYQYECALVRVRVRTRIITSYFLYVRVPVRTVRTTRNRFFYRERDFSLLRNNIIPVLLLEGLQRTPGVTKRGGDSDFNNGRSLEVTVEYEPTTKLIVQNLLLPLVGRGGPTDGYSGNMVCPK